MYLNYIVWNPNPIFLKIGAISVLWYSFLFASGFIISRFVIFSIYRAEGRVRNNLDYLLLYIILGTVIGARMGHVVFYEPFKYFNNPVSILKIWEGGLSSHGCALGILVAIYFYVYKLEFSTKKVRITKHNRQGHSWLQIVDRIAIVVALGSIFIRIGNFMNSEMIGKPTKSNYGVIFVGAKTQQVKDRIPTIHSISVINEDQYIENNDPLLTLEIKLKEHIVNKDIAESIFKKNIKPLLLKKQKLPNLIASENIPIEIKKSKQGYLGHFKMKGIIRHPSQLYEAGICVITFILLITIWGMRKEHTPGGLIWGIFLLVIFGSRIPQELIKENNVAFGNGFLLNQGQYLSLPFVMLGIYLIARIIIKKRSIN
tara:strand:+ start:1421 stop:2533 length:1113 start_codon:yes stop_codon:yes gene_type:complete